MIPLDEHKIALSHIRAGRPVSVFLNVSGLPDEYGQQYLNLLGFKSESDIKVCVILGEIANMADHYVVTANSKIVCGLHSDIFFVDEDDSSWINSTTHLN